MPLLFKIVWFERRACVQKTHLIEKYEEKNRQHCRLHCNAVHSFWIFIIVWFVCCTLHLAYLLHYTEFGWLVGMQPCMSAHGRANEQVNK